ncbi:MAG: DUF1501 domain-containing protein [Bryobacteraceae bacterium]|nr:DUF1501 domain-containing protein [Bryobacteraceae bacterium]MDW8377110.1 DUF1501 domain-containing protein [Bryobacterales bacterium]
MRDPERILRPDAEGHYSLPARRLDAESLRRHAPGRHPLDGLACAMGVEESRRRFFSQSAQGIGALALAWLLGKDTAAASQGHAGLPHFPPKAKRCIYIHLVGAPPQMETFDYKPQMKEWFNKDLPESVRGGQRLTTMTSGQSRFPIAPSIFKFHQYGKSGAWVSELLPKIGSMVDDIAIIRSMHTEAINHEPAITFFQTGSMIAGRPCIGSWLSYGLGSMNQDLPTFVVLQAKHNHPRANVQAISARLWSAGFLSGEHSGVSLRSSGDPVLFINNPDGVPQHVRRGMLDALAKMNELTFQRLGDPETKTRIAQYEMAFRMQSSVPELTDLSKEPEFIWKLYGPESRLAGSFAQSCLLARRLAERGVRFIQVYHRGWDVHGLLPEVLPSQCKEIDQPCWALVQDLKQRGMLEETLVIVAGEFGRTIYSQGKLTETDYGRDHHPRCFSLWMAGGGIKGGVVHGETDDFSYNIVRDPVHVRDFQATILHLFGIDHERFTYKYQGLDVRLTGVERAAPVKAILV